MIWGIGEKTPRKAQTTNIKTSALIPSCKVPTQRGTINSERGETPVDK